jgi:ADP-ribose pyrophosphatase YjhB (NUDIX family)
VPKFELSARENDTDWKKRIVTPRVAAAGIVESPDREYILMVKRKYEPKGYAFPGGMMEIGETVEETAKREILEETGIDADTISLLGIHSHPQSDPRWHVVIVYVLMRATSDKDPRGMDDALEAFWMKYDSDELASEFISSTRSSLDDYREWRKKEERLPKLK